MSTMIIHEVVISSTKKWHLEEDVNASSGLPCWSVAVTTNGCLEYVGNTITVEDLHAGDDYRETDHDEYQERAIRRANCRVETH